MENLIDSELYGYLQRGVASVEVTDGELIMTLTDGTVVDLGRVKGEDGERGEDGVSPEALFLDWRSGDGHPTASEIAANSEVMRSLPDRESGSYALFLRIGDRTVPAVTVRGTSVWFIDIFDRQSFHLYRFGFTGAGGSYEQDYSIFPDETFDEFSPAPASMTAIAEYVDERLGTTGNIDLTKKKNVPTQVITGSDFTLVDNTEYRLTGVRNLVLGFPQGKFECWMRLSFAATGDVSVTFPQTAKYIGATPLFANGEVWEVSVKDGVVVAVKEGSV